MSETPSWADSPAAQELIALVDQDFRDSLAELREIDGKA